jgi:hydrogenase expression/formation protein HypE
MKGGKFDDSVLKKVIFDNIKHKRKEVLLGSGTGIDSSIINLGGDLVVVTTDPITAAGNNIGRLCINICCNDIAAAGGEPVAILVTLLMPYNYDINNIEKIICELDNEAQAKRTACRRTYRKNRCSYKTCTCGDCYREKEKFYSK